MTLFTIEAQETKIGFYLQSEFSAMFLDQHIGRAAGMNIGISSASRKWDFGFRYVGRSGPINEHMDYELVLPQGENYNGKEVLFLGADHGYFGLEVAKNWRWLDNRLLLRVPVSFGQIGAGFYLRGEDRKTPDGARVSVWEDKLQDGTDAGFGLASELGAELFYHPFPSRHLSIGGGIHYTNTYAYTSFLGGDDFYNNKLRMNLGIRVSF